MRNWWRWSGWHLLFLVMMFPGYIVGDASDTVAALPLSGADGSDDVSKGVSKSKGGVEVSGKRR